MNILISCESCFSILHVKTRQATAACRKAYDFRSGYVGEFCFKTHQLKSELSGPTRPDRPIRLDPIDRPTAPTDHSFYPSMRSIHSFHSFIIRSFDSCYSFYPFIPSLPFIHSSTRTSQTCNPFMLYQESVKVFYFCRP